MVLPCFLASEGCESHWCLSLHCPLHIWQHAISWKEMTHSLTEQPTFPEIPSFNTHNEKRKYRLAFPVDALIHLASGLFLDKVISDHIFSVKIK